MHAHEALVRRLYAALDEMDGDAMAACYAADARFSDPVFPELRGPAVGAMWRMLCQRARDLEVQVVAAQPSGAGFEATWAAQYTFARTGRPVTNLGNARFRFHDGLIAEHVDEWDFHRWATQALGWQGRMLGGTGILRRKVQREAAQGLAKFRQAGTP